MKHFTNSATFDINLLFSEKATKRDIKKAKRSFDNEAIFDVNNLFK